ncbi:MAG TPA: hypothetical protein VMD29_12285, partial [Terracidiphilus sp.]|nr:hypothetical protein [Terracidiphilus sp.]
MTVEELFRSANVNPRGPKPWKEAVDESEPGVYVIAIRTLQTECPLCPQMLAQLNDFEREFERILWIPEEEIVYIGQTTKQNLKKRIGQFYRHRYGNTGPHHGGEAVHLLSRGNDLDVYWAPVKEPQREEVRMLMAFMRRHGRLPYANRDYPRVRKLF